MDAWNHWATKNLDGFIAIIMLLILCATVTSILRIVLGRRDPEDSDDA